MLISANSDFARDADEHDVCDRRFRLPPRSRLFFNRATSRKWLTDRAAGGVEEFESLPCRAAATKNGCGTDLRLFHLDRFRCPSVPASTSAALPDALLTHGVELAGSTVALDGRPSPRTLDPKWAERGVLFGSLDALVAEHGD